MQLRIGTLNKERNVVAFSGRLPPLAPSSEKTLLSLVIDRNILERLHLILHEVQKVCHSLSLSSLLFSALSSSIVMGGGSLGFCG